MTSMCDVLGVSPSAYYEWVAEQEAEHERRDAELRARIQALFVTSKGATVRRASTASSRRRARA